MKTLVWPGALDSLLNQTTGSDHPRYVSDNKFMGSPSPRQKQDGWFPKIDPKFCFDCYSEFLDSYYIILYTYYIM